MHTLKHEDGCEAVRNSCAVCGGLVYGGEVGNPRGHTIYAGSLDDPSLFKPSIGIFTRDKPDWVAFPPGLVLFETRRLSAISVYGSADLGQLVLPR